MCGIAGFAGGFVAGLMERMNAAQRHRGPDGCGVFESPAQDVALAHVRLSILDLTAAAAQPMHSPDDRFVLVFNGEIFNFAELRDELTSAGETFRSTGDTEVLLRGLQRYGAEFVGRLNGMFALALWDRRERVLLLARDQTGIKPLYYAEPEPGTLLFASEIKALAAHPRLRREPNFRVLRQHLAFSHGTESETALRGVFRLPPGSLLVWKSATRTASIRQFWTADYSTDDCGGRAAATDQLRAALDNAVRRQLISDVPLGSFLSGGLDSSLLTTIAAAHSPPGFSAYTISYPARDNRLDAAHLDAPYARRLAKQLRLRFEEIEIDADVASLWPQLIHHLDEPIADPAAITCYLISKLARERGSTVLLSGQGADELFGGYPRYRALQWFGGVDRLPANLRRALASGAAWLPGGIAGRSGAALRRARRVLVQSAKSPVERFLALCAATPDTDVARVFSAATRAECGAAHEFDACVDHISGSQASGTSQFLDRDLSVYLPNHNLLYTDKMGMAVGLEARVPFLDRELVDLATRLPLAWKVGPGILKHILRDAARGLVPDEVIDRPKAGFGAPYRKWLRHDLGAMWDDLTSRDAVARRGWFDYDALVDVRQRSQSGRDDFYMLQWAVLTIELWARHFIDENPANYTAFPSSHPTRVAA